MVFYISMLVAGILLVLFVSGAFEGLLVDRCTGCGRTEGSLTSVSFHFSVFVKTPPLIPKPLGVLHDHHLCQSCWTKTMLSIIGL